MLVRSRASRPATDSQVASEVFTTLERRAAMSDPPASIAVSDAVAVAIAGLFRSPTQSGRVMDRFHVTGAADSEELIEAARFEQGYASPEGHAALYCLIGWVNSRVHAGRHTGVS